MGVGVDGAAVSRGASSGNSTALIKSARTIFLRLIENRKRKGEGEREGAKEGTAVSAGKRAYF